MVNGKAVSLIKPPYPTAPNGEKPSGEVKVQVIIGEQGNVISAKAVSGHPMLREASEKAALASKFSPTTLQGQPAKVSGTIIYNFKPKESNEEKLKFMGLGAFFPMAKIIPMDEWDEPLSEKELEIETVLKEILLPLTKITSQTDIENRLKILNQVQTSLEKTLTGDDAWQYGFGREFGELMTEIHKIRLDHTANFDETSIKNHLSKMNALLSTVPANIPADVLGKFKEIISLGDAENFNSEENKSKFILLIMETLNLISPDSTN